jgi:hypothetical protein
MMSFAAVLASAGTLASGRLRMPSKGVTVASPNQPLPHLHLHLSLQHLP